MGSLQGEPSANSNKIFTQLVAVQLANLQVPESLTTKIKTTKITWTESHFPLLLLLSGSGVNLQGDTTGLKSDKH